MAKQDLLRLLSSLVEGIGQGTIAAYIEKKVLGKKRNKGGRR